MFYQNKNQDGICTNLIFLEAKRDESARLFSCTHCSPLSIIALPFRHLPYLLQSMDHYLFYPGHLLI